jgi:hypothetical protein
MVRSERGVKRGRSAERKLVKPTTFLGLGYLHRCPSDGILLALDLRAGPSAPSIGTCAGLPRMRSGRREVWIGVGSREDAMGGAR